VKFEVGDILKSVGQIYFFKFMKTAVQLMYLLSEHDITVVNVHTSTLIVTDALSLVIYGKLLSMLVYL
jgi:hypothetical protein